MDYTRFVKDSPEMISAKSRILAALSHRTLDRIPITETGIWPETVARWEMEGLPAGEDPATYFELDRIAVNHPFDCSFFPHEIYEDNHDYCVDQNGQGTVVKWYKNRGSSSGHMELDHRVKTLEDWKKARARLTVTDDRFLEVRPAAEGEFSVFNPVDHFWMSFTMCGMENLCCWLVESPEEMSEIYNDYTDFLVGMLDATVARGLEFDGLWFFSDMAYHSGPMFSPMTFRNVIAPGYERLRQWCTDNGKYMLLHCDGDVRQLLPEFIRIGFDWIQPLEARAGNDIRDIKGKYGERIALMGNINADILADGDRSRIEDEIASKITTAKINGGYIYHIDHSVPPTISFDSYSYAIELIRQYGTY